MMTSAHGKLVRSALLATVAAAAIACSAPAAAQVRDYNVPAESASKAIATLAKQGNVQILLPGRTAKGIRTKAVTGSMSVEDALATMLAGTGLHAQKSGAQTWIIVPLDVASAEGPSPERGQASTSAGDAEGNGERGDIVVTGSLIRGAKPHGAPVTTVTRDDIDKSGRGTIAEVLQLLPQNFSGGFDSSAAVTNRAPGTGAGVGQGTGLNLRGLGPDATLTLFNGHRLAPSGFGDYVDITAIPLAAVERIEVLTDGASATYGSDALAGVVNFIPKRNYDGAEFRGRYGLARNYWERGASFAAGKAWDSGSALVAVDYYAHSNLGALDRDITASSDLTSFGGHDFRLTNTSPGNITSPTTLAGAIPAGQDGRTLTSAQILRGVTNRQNQNAGSDVIPPTERIGVFFTGHQALSDAVEVYANGLYSWRRNEYVGISSVATLSVPSTNAFRVLNGLGLPGTAPIAITYNFVNEFGNRPQIKTAEAISGDFGFRITPPGTWSIDIYGSGGVSKEHSDAETVDQRTVAQGGELNIALASSSLDTAFNPFGDGRNTTNASVLSRLLVLNTQDARSSYMAMNVKADGKLFSLPGGAVRAAIGGELRRDTYDLALRQNYLSGTLPAPTIREGNRRVAAAFAEVSVPLVSSDMNVSFVDALSLSASVRIDSYDDLGTTTNPKVGVDWVVTKGVTLRGSWGTSFKAPKLNDQYGPTTVQYVDLVRTVNNSPDPNGDGFTRTVVLGGGNPLLAPERGRAFAFGLDVTPTAVPGLRFSATYFDMLFKDRITSVSGTAAVFQNPAVYLGTSYFTNVSQDVINAAVAGAGTVTGTPIASGGAEALIYTRPVNATRVDIRGIDASVSWSYTGRDFQLRPYASFTRYFDYSIFQTPTSPVRSGIDRVATPTEFKARAGFDINSGPVAGGLAVNYVNGYMNDTVTPNVPISSYTTVDMQVSVDIGSAFPESKALKGTRLTLSVANLFDRDTPFVDGSAFGFDATNASILGRLASLTLIKSF